MDSMTGYVMPMEPPTTGWDIHCHTAFSDGTETPAVLAEQSKAAGLKGGTQGRAAATARH